ncbi:MAG: hypothetical protein CBD69_010895 [Crocinitomicaceae bacterium TMED209]|nr:MAG: hypothetical protein CBD69_010895 [Crocinitomicaceae bacterium TMED209]
MAEIKLIDFLRAELNSFSGEEISIEDCNRITIRLWNMSNSNFQLCSEAINNLKSKNEKMDFFKTHSLSYLSKLSERLGPSDFVYKIKTDNKKQKKSLEYDILFKKFSNTQIILGSTLALIILSTIIYFSIYPLNH